MKAPRKTVKKAAHPGDDKGVAWKSKNEKAKKLIPPDLKRCQAEIGGAFMLGPGRMRCENAPDVVVKETKPGEDGLCGSMSLCFSCFGAFQKQGLADSVKVTLLSSEAGK